MSLPEALERAASALSAHADAIRDANGDPVLLLEVLPADAASQVLAWLLEDDLESGGELALAWAESEPGAIALQSVDAQALAKPARKALRRAVHRLRSRGVAPREAPAQASTLVARLPEIDEGFEAALLSALDSRGARMVYLLESQASGGARLFEAVLDEGRGVVDFSAYSAGRSAVRSFLRDIKRRSPAATFEVEPDLVRALLARAAAHQPDERPAPRSFVEHRSRLGLDATLPTPGMLVAAALGDVAPEAGALERVAEQVRQGALGPWPPELDCLRKLGETAKEQLGGRVIVSGATKQQHKQAVLGETADALFDAGFAEKTSARLRETAFVHWKRAQEADARDCLAAADAFEAGSASGNPVALALVETLLAPVWAEIERGDPEEPEDGEEASPLITTP